MFAPASQISGFHKTVWLYELICSTVKNMRSSRILSSFAAAGLPDFAIKAIATAHDFLKRFRTTIRKHIVSTMRKWLSPSYRYKIGRLFSWLREVRSKACFWNWEVIYFIRNSSNSCDINYIGRKAQRDSAIALLNTNLDLTIIPSAEQGSDRRVIISEIPFPGSMCAPSLLNSIIPLGRPIEAITSNFHSQLRRELRKNRSRYHMRQVLDITEIEQADRDMLRPYAIARHGSGASQIELDEVIRMALEYGRLDLLLSGDAVVGCQLGHVITRDGKRYWSTNRCGYPEAVFSDPKRLRDCNSFNIYLAMEWAIENNFDYYDIGVSLGRPGDGLLEWKRRRGGELNTLGNSNCFHIRLPKVGSAQFLWDTPLFGVERNKLTLHLGLPDGPSDEAFLNRYREMGFGGLFKVCLHSSKPPGKHIMETLHGYYAHQKSPPLIEIIAST